MNTDALLTVCGGIGLFLLGMLMLTDSLKSLAGNSLKNFLARFTGGTFSSILSGAAVTTLVQSSHATTIATIGFVSAGLLTFRQSLGIIFGANLGTTTIGWIVSLIGFKIKMSTLALPLVTAGALARLSGKEKLVHVGNALAGFGLIFISVDLLQEGLKGYTDLVAFTSFSGESIHVRLLLVLAGIVMTIVMQSSGAAVTSTLAALNIGAIDIYQAAALVIGQNIGTTITAGIAAIGTSTQAKRTATAHIMFNVTTAMAAFFILHPLVVALAKLLEFFGEQDPTLVLSAFHTVFNVLGILLITPVIGPFSRMIEKMIPAKESNLTRHLGSSTGQVPAIAIETARRTVREIFGELLLLVDSGISQGSNRKLEDRVAMADDALQATREYLGKIRTGSGASEIDYKHHVALLHAIEHLEFIIGACREKEIMLRLSTDHSLSPACTALREKLHPLIEWLHDDLTIQNLAPIKEASEAILDMRRQKRTEILESTAEGHIAPEAAYDQIESLRWLDRVAYRVWRAVFYLAEPVKQ